VPDEEQVPVKRPVAAPTTSPPEEELSLADHRMYSQQLYGKPAWVLEGVFAASQLDPAKDHTVATVKKALDDMLATPDKRYEGKK